MLHILQPGIIPAFLFGAFSASALIYIFISGREETLPAYILYGFSAYAMTVLIIEMIEPFRRLKSCIYKNKVFLSYKNDVNSRLRISLFVSLAVNIVYAVFKLTACIYYKSFWYGADAVFYIILSLAKFLLLNKNQNLKSELKKYRFCGILIFILNIAFSAVVYQTISKGMGYEYPGYMIYIAAMYTFYCFISGLINIIKYRKYKRPVYSAQKAISFVKALVALFALQTAMLASFNEDIVFEKTINTITGILVCCVISSIAFIILKSKK